MLAFNNIGSLGRLGNQMFEYAALRGIAARHSYEWCIPPPENKGIMDNIYDVVYPYGQGMYQKQVAATDITVSKFLETGDYEFLNAVSQDHTSDFGWAQFFKTSVYKEGGMENENFRAYAPEDKERFYRFTTLGYNVGRVNDYVYHLEHARGENSWFSNPHMESNMAEWTKIQGMSKDNLLQYYSEQEYLKKYACV